MGLLNRSVPVSQDTSNTLLQGFPDQTFFKTDICNMKHVLEIKSYCLILKHTVELDPTSIGGIFIGVVGRCNDIP